MQGTPFTGRWAIRASKGMVRQRELKLYYLSTRNNEEPRILIQVNSIISPKAIQLELLHGIRLHGQSKKNLQVKI